MAGGNATNKYGIEIPQPGATREERMEALAKLLNISQAIYNTQRAYKGLKPVSNSTYANYLGIGPSTYSYMVTMTREPSEETLDRIATRLGPIVYRIFDKPPRIPKSPLAQRVFEKWADLPESRQRQLVEMIDNWLEEEQGGEDSQTNIGNAATA